MLFPAAEEQARRKEEGQQGEEGGKKENQMVILLTVDGSRAEHGYDPNGKEQRTEEEGCEWVPRGA